MTCAQWLPPRLLRFDTICSIMDTLGVRPAGGCGRLSARPRVIAPPNLVRRAMPTLDTLFRESFENIAENGAAGIFELLHTGIALMSATGHFLYCNRAFLEMFNLPEDVIGRHITEYFLTGELGVMSTIRTRKMVVCSSMTTTKAKGISFRYPVLDAAGELRGVVVESIAADIGKDKLLALMDTVRNLEIRANYYDQKGANKSGLATFENIIGESRAVENMRIRGRRFALSSEPIHLTGESGTGKEVVAQALHMAGLRADKPFVTVNCAALPQELMEAEMFGYASGAFTGAKTGGIKGKFKMADTGTILLDEIGEIPLPLQAKFLRVLESGEIQKLAHTGSPIVSDFRVIAATNRDLADMVEQGRFREDLYHRLNIFELHIPPLRERTEDIPLLTKHFITRSVGDRRAKNIRVDGELYRVFARYPWRGNIRELKNVLTYALYTLGDKGDTLGVRHLPKRFLQELGVEATEVRPAATEQRPTPEPERATEAPVRLCTASARAERNALAAALANVRYNKSAAAKVLGISRSKLYRKLREYKLLGVGE